MSLDLKTKDIVGAQAGTKGLGAFAEKARQSVRSNITTQDIEGAQSGTIRKGPLSKRLTNPVNPDYPELGNSQKLRQDYAYAEPWKEQPIKKSGNRSKPEWKKSTVIPIIEDKKVEAMGMQSSDTLTAAANVD